MVVDMVGSTEKPNFLLIEDVVGSTKKPNNLLIVDALNACGPSNKQQFLLTYNEVFTFNLTMVKVPVILAHRNNYFSSAS